MSADGEGMATVGSTQFRRARKQHWCDGCSEPIRRGDRYRYESGLWDDRWDDFKYCARCSALIDAILAQPGNDGFVHGFNCGHSWWEVFDGDPPEHVARLAFMTPEEAQAALQQRKGPVL